MRGRKKQDGAYRVIASFRINEEQSGLLKRNKFMHQELQNMVRDYLDCFLEAEHKEELESKNIYAEDITEETALD